MAIMWSRIHAELGLSPAPLTHAMVAQAVDQRVVESEDLDWKLDFAWKKENLPAEVKEKKKWEFAKDVTSMANTRGGLIVFGVREDNERPVELTGVPNGERDRQPLRAFVNKYVRPLVGGLLIEALDSEDGSPGLVAVFVPPSPDAPHVIGERNELGVPYRYGSDTNWMSESELERAYRDRFARRADDRAALTALIDGLIHETKGGWGVWVAVAACPVASLPMLPGPQRAAATKAMDDAMRLAVDIFGSARDRHHPMLDQIAREAVNNPRTGLRRWVIRPNHYSTDPTDQPAWALVELHHDGSVAVAMRLTGVIRRDEIASMDFDATWVPVRFVDAVVAEAVALSSVHVRGLGGVGTILARAALLKENSSTPLVAIDNQLHGRMNSMFRQVPGTRAVREPVAVETAFSAADDVVALRGAARQLADDLVHQFGVPSSSIPD
ncbi:helix-turn-helix domain-containing protein [Kibdelosporangium persicum]|nr:ATP-binding protein [Kibdelosporangium persicum]